MLGGEDRLELGELILTAQLALRLRFGWQLVIHPTGEHALIYKL